MRDRHRRLAGGRDAVDVGGFEHGIGHRVERRVGVQLDLRHVGDDAEPGCLGGADNGDRFRLDCGQLRAKTRRLAAYNARRSRGLRGPGRAHRAARPIPSTRPPLTGFREVNPEQLSAIY